MRIKDYAFIKVKDETWIKVDFNTIVYIKAGTNYSHLFCENGNRIIYRNPLIKLQNMLPLCFERVHNSYIINIKYISEVNFIEKNILLNNKMSINIGHAYRENIEKYFLNTIKRKP